jgi:hypothetical protein
MMNNNKRSNSELLEKLFEIDYILNSLKDCVIHRSREDISENIGKFNNLFSEFINKLREY